jgi:hypothetical protein
MFGTDHELFGVYSGGTEQLPVSETVPQAPHVMACDGSMDFETQRYVR